MSGNNFNAQTISEFRKNHGKVGGYFEGAPILLIHSVGARTERLHLVPVMYLKDGTRYLVFASKGGAPTHPDWFHNLKAHPDVEIEIGDDKIRVHAEEIKGPERDRLYGRQSQLYPQFAGYQQKTKRTIPVVAFTKRN